MRIDRDLTPPLGAHAKDEPSAAAKTAKELEAHFVRQMLAEVRQSTGAIAGGGFAGDTFHEMLDGAIADAMTKGEGLGIAKMVESQLESAKTEDTSAPAPTSRTAPLKVSSPRSIRRYGGGNADNTE